MFTSPFSLVCLVSCLISTVQNARDENARKTLDMLLLHKHVVEKS